jgi:uncharacterized protein YcnI
MIRRLAAVTLGSALLVMPQMLAAHVTLGSKEASPNSSYKAVLRVGHGCEGEPTTAIRVQIPDGVIAVKPMPKSGWQLDTVKDKYDRPYDYFGSELTEGVKQIAWTGGRLRDDFYDEFVSSGGSLISSPARCSTSRPCRSARARCIAGSRSRRPARTPTSSRSPRRSSRS